MIAFLDFVSKIAVFVKKKLLPFTEYKNFYEIANQIIQGHIFWSGLYFEAVKFKIGRSRVFFTGSFTGYFQKILFGAFSGFYCDWFCLKTSVTHILLLLCGFQVKILLIYGIWGQKMAKNGQNLTKMANNAIWRSFLTRMLTHLYLKSFKNNWVKIVCFSIARVKNFITIPLIVAEKNIILQLWRL